MENFGTMRLGGEYLQEVEGSAITAVVAAGSNDDTWINGPVIDRNQAGGPWESIVAALVAEGTIGSSETMDLHLKIQHGDESDLSDAADYTDEYGNGGAGATAITTVADGADENGIAKLSVSLVGAKRYVRICGKVDMSASGTDTANHVSCGFLLGGRSHSPAA